MELNVFRTLRGSGLRVGPIALGTMTFGDDSKFKDSPGRPRVRRLAEFAGGCQPDSRVRAGHRQKCG